MKTFKNYLMIFAAAIMIVSCSEEAKKSDPDAPDGKISSQTDVDLVVDNLQGDITGDITLSADEAWVLTGPLVVKEGATLTIEPGTTIKASAGGTNVFLAVERNGDIQAVGTAAEPIRFTSNAASPEAGDWGGIMIMGNSRITGSGLAVTEVVDYIYGNNGVNINEADNSGTLSYVIIEYTGARINDEKEFNGLTLYAVGDGTTINNIFINHGDDDGIEFFGGTVDVSNILIVNAKDDMFDWTQGYTGTATNIYGVRELGYDAITADPRGLEGDGNLDGLTPGLTPQSNPTINNLTIVNNSTLAGGMVDVFKIRRGSAVTVTNANVIFSAATPAPGDFVDFKDAAGDGATAASINVTGTGVNINTADVVYQNSNPSTVTVPANANSGCASSTFSWTGYTFN